MNNCQIVYSCQRVYFGRSAPAFIIAQLSHQLKECARFFSWESKFLPSFKARCIVIQHLSYATKRIKGNPYLNVSLLAHLYIKTSEHTCFCAWVRCSHGELSAGQLWSANALMHVRMTALQAWVNPVLAKRVMVRASSPIARHTDPKTLCGEKFHATHFAGPVRALHACSFVCSARVCCCAL
jgi:hypothetical protein